MWIDGVWCIHAWLPIIMFSSSVASSVSRSPNVKFRADQPAVLLASEFVLSAAAYQPCPPPTYAMLQNWLQGDSESWKGDRLNRWVATSCEDCCQLPVKSLLPILNCPSPQSVSKVNLLLESFLFFLVLKRDHHSTTTPHLYQTQLWLLICVQCTWPTSCNQHSLIPCWLPLDVSTGVQAPWMPGKYSSPRPRSFGSLAEVNWHILRALL